MDAAGGGRAARRLRLIDALRDALAHRRVLAVVLLLPLVLAVLLPFAEPPERLVAPELQVVRPRSKPRPLPKPPPSDPVARAVDRLARAGVVIRRGGGRRRWVALTFDDGPGPYTRRVLDELRRLRVPATFFQVGALLHQYPEPALLTADDSSLSIGEHTFSHKTLTRLSRAEQNQEIVGAAAVMAQLGEPPPRLFRPPYGAWDADTLALTRARGMAMVLWSVDSEDYTRPGAERIARNVVRDVRPGAIVLMHDGGGDRSQTIKALPKIVKRLRRRGYGFVTVDRLIAEDPPRARRGG